VRGRFAPGPDEATNHFSSERSGLQAVDYCSYVAGLRRWAGLGSLDQYGVVVENGRDYPLLRLTVPGRQWLTVTSGFHGEEPAGPLTLLEHLGELAEYARARGVGLRVYPCINPSGFEAGTRYNASGERPNNDMLRYEVAPGVWRGELRPGERFVGWRLYQEGPKESRALRDDLSRFEPPRAALDLHQDRYLAGRYAYAYVFGDLGDYRPMMNQTVRLVDIARRALVDEAAGISTDAEGFVVYHDGSITDWFWRQGVPYTAVLETTCETPLEVCHRVNLSWLRGFVDLAAR
jgi:hypothetical protein